MNNVSKAGAFKALSKAGGTFKKAVAALLMLLIASSQLFLFTGCGKNGEIPEDTQAGLDITDTSKKGSVLFSKTVAVNDGTQARVDFIGSADEGISYVTTIKTYVDNRERGTLDLTDVSKEVKNSDKGAESADAEFLFESGDYDFDGNADIMIQSWDDESNKSYYCCLWDNANNCFKFGFQIDNPLFDAANKRIYSAVYENGVESYGYVYSLTDELKLFLEKSFSMTNEPEFNSDLSAYEQYMNPEDRDGYLILVNKTELLDASYAPDDLYDLVDTRSDRAARQMRYTAAMALEAMYIEMRSAGYTDVSVTSAYRSYGEQESLYNTYINQEMEQNGYSYERAKEVVDTYSAAPGTSEHQTGLCCDMHNLPAADQAFAKQDVYRWLKDNAWKFGFILRFPEDKEDITTYEFEPWHFRFVGRYHAEKIYNYGLCLEEYLGLIG